jgi:hypothetical protein
MIPDAETWIALAALVVSIATAVHAAFAARRLTRLQEWVAHYDLEAHRAAEAWAHKADLRVRLEKHPEGFLVWNAGGAAATGVRVQITATEGGRSPIERDAQRKLPLARLDPEEECPLIAAIYWDYDTAFDVVLTWQDPDGSERRSERRVYT